MFRIFLRTANFLLSLFLVLCLLLSGAYAAYAALRMAGRSVPPFDKWLDGVERLDMLAAAPRNDNVEDTDHANPTD